MNWMPNSEGLKWFLNTIWPTLHLKFPNLRFFIASKEKPSWLKKFKSNEIQLVGEVEDARKFISSKSIMIVPLLSGSGIRIKIIEGMALGKAVVTTTIGAEGIDYTKGKDILIADNKEEFINCIEACTSDKEFIKSLGKNARKTIVANYNAKNIMKKVEIFYQEIIKLKI